MPKNDEDASLAREHERLDRARLAAPTSWRLFEYGLTLFPKVEDLNRFEALLLVIAEAAYRGEEINPEQEIELRQTLDSMARK